MSYQGWLVQTAAGLGLGASVIAFLPDGATPPPAPRSRLDGRADVAAAGERESVPHADGTSHADGSSRAEGAPRAEIGPRYDSDAAMKAHAVEVASYTMHAVLDAGTKVIHGDGTIVWQNTAKVSTRELFVHLYLNAFKNDRTLFMREPLGKGGRGNTRPAAFGHIDVHKLAVRELDGVDLWPLADKTSPGDAEDETDIRVALPRDIAPGETLTLDAVWDAKLPSIVERTGYANDFFMVGQWFPKIARLEADGQWRHFPFHHLAEFYADFGTYEVTLDVPAGMVVGATGTAVASAREKGRDRFVYRQSDVHDFAWTAWPEFREKTATAGGVALRILYPPGYDAIAARELDIAGFGLAHFGALYGAYPYPTLTIVHPPSFAEEAGGMEYPTLMTTGRPWYDPPFIHDLEALVLHELGHQYFYGLIATDEARWPFLDEGVDSFAESDALSARFGAGVGADLLGYRVDARARLRAGAAAIGQGEPVAAPAADFASVGSYAALVYTRAAAILDTLARIYGREALLSALGRYARRYRFEHPTLPDFVSAVREVVGPAAAKNLEIALFDQGTVDYAIADATSQQSAGADGAWEGWALVTRQGNLSFPVDIELWGADGSKQIAHWEGDGADTWVRIPYRGASELAHVLVDPALAITLDANLLNNGLRLAPKASPHRTLERLTYFAALGLDWVMP